MIDRIAKSMIAGEERVGGSYCLYVIAREGRNPLVSHPLNHWKSEGLVK